MKRGMAATLGLGLVVSCSMAASVARADPPGHYIAPEVIVTGHRLAPSAAIELTKAKPRVALAELKQPLASRVADAVAKDPF